MAELYPTPARLTLLDEIEAGRVWEDWSNDEPGTIAIEEYPGRQTRVTGKVRIMKLAGWCQTEPDDAHPHARRISLIEKGHEVRQAGRSDEDEL